MHYLWNDVKKSTSHRARFWTAAHWKWPIFTIFSILLIFWQFFTFISKSNLVRPCFCGFRFFIHVSCVLLPKIIDVARWFLVQRLWLVLWVYSGGSQAIHTIMLWKQFFITPKEILVLLTSSVGLKKPVKEKEHWKPSMIIFSACFKGEELLKGKVTKR